MDVWRVFAGQRSRFGHNGDRTDEMFRRKKRQYRQLEKALKDPEAGVREVASEALIRWSSPAVARRLVEALTSPVLRGPASELLARMGTSAVDPLVNLLREGHHDIAAHQNLAGLASLQRWTNRSFFPRPGISKP